MWCAYAEVNETYERLTATCQSNIDKLQDALTSRKRIETSVTRLSTWVSETHDYCRARQLQLDAPVEQLQEQLRKHEQLSAAAVAHQAQLLALTQDEQLDGELAEADLRDVTETVAELKENFNRFVVMHVGNTVLVIYCASSYMCFNGDLMHNK